MFEGGGVTPVLWVGVWQVLCGGGVWDAGVWQVCTLTPPLLTPPVQPWRSRTLE